MITWLRMKYRGWKHRKMLRQKGISTEGLVGCWHSQGVGRENGKLYDFSGYGKHGMEFDGTDNYIGLTTLHKRCLGKCAMRRIFRRQRS